VLLASLNHSAVTAGRYLADVVRIGYVVYRRGDHVLLCTRARITQTPYSVSSPYARAKNVSVPVRGCRKPGGAAAPPPRAAAAQLVSRGTRKLLT
jgi:hypothetical protein